MRGALRRGAGKITARVSQSADGAAGRQSIIALGGSPAGIDSIRRSSQHGASIVATALGLGCRAVVVEWRALDRRSVRLAQAAGLDVAAYTVRRRPTYERLEGLGVVAICVEAQALDG